MKLLIVDDPYARNVLASIRSLATSGLKITIDVADQRKKNLVVDALISKYIHKQYHTTDPNEDFKKYKKEILKLIKKNKYDFLLAYGFLTTVSISKFKKQIEQLGVAVPISDFEVIMKAHDKEECFKIAKRVGLKIPKTYFHKNLDDLMKKKIIYPVVIKARRNSGIAKGFRIAKDEKELRKHYSKMNAIGKLSFIQDFTRPVVQEFIPGKIYDGNLFMDNGKVISSVFQIRTECLDGNIGPGIHNRTLNNKYKKPGLNYAKTILKALGWKGSTQVEMILDDRTKEFKLVEVNPKLWGTLDLSLKAGVNFPLNMIRYYYMKEKIEPIKYPEIDYYWIYDILSYRIRKRKKLNLKEIKRYYDKGIHEIMFNDLKPEIARIMLVISQFLRRK